MNRPADIEASTLKAWHDDEERWWNANGAYMNFQWQLTPNMSQAIRGKLEEDYKAYLLQPGEALLDIGCGSGWLSAWFADHGMRVLGIDISPEQIAGAVAMSDARKSGVLCFEVANFVNWDATSYRDAFSSIFVSAFLHHLPAAELRLTLDKIASVVKPGGRVYLYEPLQMPGRRSLAVKFIDRIYNLGLKLALGILPNCFGWWSARHTAEIARGYTMNSPHEAPVAFEVLASACRGSFEIAEIRGWHLNSLGFGMQSMGLSDGIRSCYEPLVALSYRLDRLLLGSFGWRAFSMPGRFILCSVKMVRK